MWVKILLLFFVFSFLFRTDASFDQDLGRHLKLGEIILKTHQIPNTNLFSYTNPNFPFINTHWLFEVLAYFLSQAFGLQSLLILKITIFLISVWLIIKIIPGEKQIFLLPIGFIFLHVLRERLELRPEIFSFLFTAVTYFILERFIKNNRDTSLRMDSAAILLLPLIQLIWINTHIYFFVGLILQVIFLLHLLHLQIQSRGTPRLKTLVIVFILSVLASLINPNGLTGFLYPLEVNKNYGYTIVENQTMFLLESIGFKDPNFIFVKLCWGIIVLSLAVAIIKRKFEIRNILLPLTGLGLSLMNVRSFPYLFLLSLPTAIINFSQLKPPPKLIRNLIFTAFTAMLLFESISYLNGKYYRSRDDDYQISPRFVEKGKNALDFVLKQNLPNPIFNNFDIGSYIIYRGYPKYQVFVDGRPEAYPKEFFQDVYIPMQSDYSKFKIEEQKRGFKTVIFSHTDQTPWGISFLDNIVKDQDWKLVFIDDFMTVFVSKEAALTKELKIIDLSTLNPQSYNFDNHVSYLRLGLFLIRNKYLQSGQRFIEKAAQIYPKSPFVQAVLTSGKNIPQ